MLTAYIRSAMRYAQYQIIEDHTFYGEIAPLAGVYANADTLEGCREELQEVLEGWILLGLHFLPPVDCIQLDIVKETA